MSRRLPCNQWRTGLEDDVNPVPPVFPVSKFNSRKDVLPAQKSQKRSQPTKPEVKKVAAQAQLKQKPTPASAVKRKGGLPVAPINRGLRSKLPRDKGGDQIQKRLQKQSPWFNSIINPLHGADAKIPDETGVETGTTQVVFKDTVTANSFGVAGWRTVSLYINDVEFGETGYGRNFDHLAPTAGLGSVGWVSQGQWPGADDLKAITNAHRVVSASLVVMPETSLSQNQGEFTLFSAPFTTETSPLYTDYVNKYKSTTMPLNCGKPGIVRWYPVTKEDISFKSFMTTNADAFSETISNIESCPLWELGFLAAGCEPDATFRITMVVNYEFIPRFNTLNVLDVSPSPADATEVDMVENWVQDMDVAAPTSFAVAASAPKTVSPQHGENDDGTGFGMFFNVVKEILPFAAALLI